MSNSDDEFVDILRQTETILTEARLNKIAKENKSIGAMLDQRQLHPMEEVLFRTKKSIQAEVDKRIHSRRGGRGERDIKPQAALVLEAFREKGVHVDLLTGGYALELNMWKNNARKGVYAEQRKYKFPELHHFAVTMDVQQRAQYKERIGAHLIRVAEELREECRAIKTEMDLNGIFHPEANSHRVHCIYIMKLHKKITPENVEDHILRKMYHEALVKQRAEQEIEKQKEAILLTIAAEEEAANNKRRRQRGLIDANQPTPPSTAPKAVTAKASPPKSPAAGAAGIAGTVRGKKEPVSSGKPVSRTTVPSKKLVKKSNSVPSMRAKSREGQTGQTPTASSIDGSTETGGSHPSPERRYHSPAKIFSKMNRPDKMGFIDSSSILKEEAAKFAATETILLRKPRDKNMILEEKISLWMLNGIQQQQIEKANTRSTTIIPNDRNVWAASADRVAAMSSSNYSPSKVLPFNDYYSLLRECNEEEEVQSSPAARSPASDVRGERGSTKTATFADDNVVKPPEARAPAPLNLIKHFAENDKNFDAYLKINELEQPSAKLFAKLNTTKASKNKRVRRVAPLGRDAVHLVDSRGKASRLAGKGFVNVFRAATRKTKANDQEGDSDSDSDSSSEADESSAIERLDGLELEDDASSVASSNTGGLMPNTMSPKTMSVLSPDASKRSLYSKSRSRRRLPNGDSNLSSPNLLTGRKKHAGILDDNLDDMLYPSIADNELDLQCKLQATWDCLQMPAMDRLAFMTKYSTQAYASEMGRAIDLWADAAICLVLFKEALLVRSRTAANALAVSSSKPKDLMADFFRRIPPLLASKSNMFIPLTAAYERNAQAEALSAITVVQMRQMFKDFVVNITSNGTAGTSTDISDRTAEVALLQKKVNVFTREVGMVALQKVEMVEKGLNDQLHFAGKLAKEWILAQEVMKVIETEV